LIHDAINNKSYSLTMRLLKPNKSVFKRLLTSVRLFDTNVWDNSLCVCNAEAMREIITVGC